MFFTTFRSLANRNYRIWAAGALVSNIGTWMQRIAQDWLVLTELTHNNASAVGIVMSLQFVPQLLLLPWSGWAADRFDRRKFLIFTQSALGLVTLVQGLLVILGVAELWQVYVLAFLFGCAAALDLPARQAFVSDLVGEGDLVNAVGLNSTSFNAARMIGPAVAGAVIAAVGTGWVFIINAASFAVVLATLWRLKTACITKPRRSKTNGGLMEGLRYIAGRNDLITALVMAFLICTFGLNFPIFISTMSVREFHAGAGQYGVSVSIMAVGTLMGALIAASRANPSMRQLLLGAGVFGIGCIAAAVAPSYGLFAAMLVVIGLAAQTFNTSCNGLLQLTTAPEMRGRVLAIYLALALGGTPLGAPLVGWVADMWGPRWAMGVAAASGILAAAAALLYFAHLRKKAQQLLLSS
ncbi:MFS family permease [Rhizomicrobium palustre]|uniref:MFS family permease n=1 Tax=Rhizomicrobium palustre TaxID=189966 RepID=A0A846N4M3_9PROT|nr:MFS transporter [Rhizomicrobium palustre]NIK90425.1 MFS family permease [Rhizomicrobium palustre]